MKADRGNRGADRGNNKAAAPPGPQRSGELPRPDDPPEAGEADEGFHDVPTVANRAIPAGGDAPREEPPASPPQDGAGAYRLVRPTVSDFVEQPIATKIDPSAAKRVILGSARKPR